MKFARLLLFFAFLSIATTSAAARAFAQDCPPASVGCDVQDLDWMWHAALFDAVSLDTGWVPAGSPIQLHFAFHLAGMTDIAMGGTAITSWPSPLTLGFEGRARTGSIAVDYGYELTAEMRFSLDVAGTHYSWTGDIPLPGGIPRTIALMGETVFDPFVLPMTTTARPVLLTTSTARFPVFMYDAIGSFVSVPGVGGGIAVDLAAAMTAAYQSDRIVVAGASPIVVEHGTTTVLPPSGSDFGPGIDVTAHPEGTLTYDGTLFAYPNLYITIAGRRFDYDLATIPIPIGGGVPSNVVFEDETAHVPLPDVVGIPTMLDFGDVAVGATHVELLDVRNDGEATLVVHPRPLAGDFLAEGDTLTVPPHATERLPLDFTPSTAGPAAVTLFLETNDPDHPLLVVALRGNGLAPPPPDMGELPMPDGGMPVVDAGGPRSVSMGGCCRVGGASQDGPASLLVVAGLAALVALRRRRR